MSGPGSVPGGEKTGVSIDLNEGDWEPVAQAHQSSIN